MKEKNFKRWLPVLYSTGGVFIFSGIMFFLYRQSLYLPFLLGGIFFLLLATVNLILLLFHGDIPLKEKPDTAKEESEEIQKKQKNAFARFCLWALKWICKAPRGLALLYNRCREALRLILLLGALVGGSVWFGIYAWSEARLPAFKYWHLVTLVAVFVAAIVIDRFCKHLEVEDECVQIFLKNARAYFAVVRIIIATLGIAVTMQVLNVYDIRKYLVYAYIAFFYYVAVLVLFSIIVRVIRRELSSRPTIVILIPFANADLKELSFISFLEENTGLTLRSLWSIKYVRKILPATIVGTCLLFWLATGVVYVKSCEEAAVYRFGVLQEETLKPGLHMTFPYPIDKTEIYDTQIINKITIGYKSEENIDNVWTKAHGESEYMLLLGSGDEVVSMNLRVEYRIDDLIEYLGHATNPASIMEAEAYEIATARTMNTDLATLLSVNREAFANSFYEELSAKVDATDMGLEIVNVIMESIHPPVDVAEVYQDFIAVGIQAEKIITDAEAEAAVLGYQADASSYSILSNAQSDHFANIASARSEVAEFMAAVEAYEEFPDTYRYYKYLNAIASTYQKADLVILGEGVDGSRIYWGSFTQMN